IRSGAGPRLARVGLCARVAVAAGGAVGGVRIRADAGRGVAGARDVALVGGGADDGVAACAGARLAGIGLRARVAVAAGGAVGGVRIRADAGRGVAGPRDVALLDGGPADGIRAGAGPRLAGVGLCARVAVVAGGAVGGVRIRADAGRRVAGPRHVTLIQHRVRERVRSGAAPRLAGVGLCARVAVVAGGAVGGVRIRADAGRRVAGPRHVTLIQHRVRERVRSGAAPRLAGVGLCARVAVVAGGAVGGVRIRADAGRRVAGPRHVTLVERSADERVRSGAGPRLAGVGLCAGVAVAAGGAVGGVRIRADAGRRVAGPRHVTLIERRADDRVRSGAGPRLAGVGLCAGVAVAAGGAVGGVRIRADAGRRVAGPRHVT